MTPPRIALMGASGTGKTTLARELSRRLCLPMEQWLIPEEGGVESTTRHVARKLFGEPLPYLATPGRDGTRAKFQNELLVTKRSWELAHLQTGFVTDRTHVCNAAYWFLEDSAGPGRDSRYLELIRDAMRTYSHVWLCSVDEFYHAGQDPARKSDLAYQRAVEALMIVLCEQFRIPFSRVRGSGAQERAALVQAYAHPSREVGG